MLPWDYVKPLENLDEQTFKNPPKRFSPIPFWFWNDEMDEEKINWELNEFKDKGITSFFIHGRFGLKVPYLSQEWFRKVEYAVSRAKELGLKVWIYDEYNWPSGTAGLQVPKRFPELRGKVLEAVLWRFRGPIFVFPTLGDSRYMNLKDARLVHAVAVPTKDLNKLPISLIDLTPSFSFGEAISWESPDEDITLILFLEKEVEWYIDPFDENAVKKFIELTHEKYYETIGREFGSNVLGFYTDEPAYYYYRTGEDIPAIPWSKNFLKQFLEEKGYDLKEFLPALFLDVGKKTAKIRCDFWEFITKAYAEAFYKRISEWCHQHGVLFTGHLLFEDDLRRHVRCEGNVFEHLKYFDIVGVDHLYPRIGTPDRPEEHVAPKIASSAAHHCGSPRCLCESFGGIYWDTNFERMKWLTDWEYVLGINLLNPHGFHYSIEGDRKRDWPPSQFYHHPFWKYYGRFSEYVARLTYMLSGGRHVADVLLLFPIVSAWANYTPQERTFLFDIIEKDFYYLTDALLRIHRDYDYVDEEVLKDAEIVNDKIKIGNETYSILLLPPITTVKASTAKKIKEFYESGGKVVATVLLPFQSAECGEDKEIAKMFKEIFGVEPFEILKELNSERDEKIHVFENKNEKGGRACFIKTSLPLHMINPIQLIQKILSEFVEEDVKIDCPDVFYLHKNKGGLHLYFITNLSEKTCQFTVDLKEEGKPEIWNPENGEITDVPVYRIENGRTKIPLSLEGHNSVFLVLKPKSEEPHITKTNILVDKIERTGGKGLTVTAYAEKPCEAYIEVSHDGQLKRVSLGRFKAPQIIGMPERWRFALEDDNCLLLEVWKIKLVDNEESPGEDWFKVQYNDSTWRMVQCGPLLAYCDKLPKAVLYRSRFIVEGGEVKKMLLDGISGLKYDIFINGEPVKPKVKSSKLDVNITEVDVEGKIRKGENVIAILIKPSSLKDGLLDPIRLLGSFEVQTKAEKIVLTPLRKELLVGKSWTEQGFPYYSGTITYEQEIHISPSLLRRKIVLDCGDVRDHLEVIVNEEPVAIKLWRPYTIDLTGKLKAGNNRLKLKVTNTATNIITGKRAPSGLLSNVKLIAYDARRVRLL